MGRVRQADIARVAGVSQATVSVVLGGNRTGVRLSERTRLRVLEAAERLGYAADPVPARSGLFGVYTCAPVFGAEAHHPILAGVEAEAAALGKDLLMFTAPRPVRLRRSHLAEGGLFLGRQIPGELLSTGFPVVSIGRAHPAGRLPHVDVDYAAASAEVLTRLARAGHRRVRYLRDPDDSPASQDMNRGVRTAAAETGVEVRPDYPGPGAVRRWLDEGVTALLVEETATGAVFDATQQALRAAGVSVPGDLSLAVLGRPPAGPAGPQISGFEIPRRALGRAAVRLLASLVDTGAGEPPRLLACPPVVGETIARVAFPDRP